MTAKNFINAPLQKKAQNLENTYFRPARPQGQSDNKNRKGFTIMKKMDITNEMIIKELVNRGYKAELQTGIKNGVEVSGICIAQDKESDTKDMKVNPVIYTDSIIRELGGKEGGFEKAVSEIIGVYERNHILNFHVSELFDRNFILSHVYVALQRESSEELVKRDACGLDGIESYLYVRRDDGEGEYSVKLKKELLEKAGIPEDEAWERAAGNVNAETTIQSMDSVIAEIMGAGCGKDMGNTMPFYILSNQRRFRGASSILNKEMLLQFAKKQGVDKIVALPSSVHEFILIPYHGEVNLEEYSKMVYEVNHSQVEPQDRLTDRAYLITL